MAQSNLNRIFTPRQVAVVGASEKAGTIGNALMRNLVDGRFSGTVLPVNPKYKTMHGQACFESVSALETGVDLAVIATPIHSVPDIVSACVEKKIGGAVIISAGGKEVGEAGREIEEKIRRIANDGGLRIVGPNCMGIMRPGVNLNASFAAEMPVAGNLAFVSQSGAICTAILDLALKERIGFSHFVSIGSMLDVDFGDMIDFLGNDSSAKSILLYIESLTNFRKFMSAARSVSRIKPIIVLKSGRSPAGARAAASHTGAMAGEDAVYDAAFKRAGIVRVDTIEELFDCAELMAKQPRPRGPRHAILTNGGGPGVMATDTLARYAQKPAPLDPETLQAFDAFLPDFWSRGNPIDILGDASAERFDRALTICFNSKNLDGVLVILAPQALTDPLSVAETLAAAIQDRRFPVFACWMGDKRIATAVDVLNAAGITTYDTPERAVRAFMYMVEYARNLDMLLEVPPKMAGNMTFDQENARRLITGAPVQGFVSESDANKILTASDALTTGLIGRHPGDRDVRWLKQQRREVPLSDRGWLYGIEKAARHIRQYRTIILVEGIFDYFAFYSLLQDQGKLVVVSTLGSYVTPEVTTILMSLDIQHFIVAYNWDELGRNGIERMAAKSNGWVYYLGGPAEDQAPYDMLKPVVDAISGFSLETPDDGCAMRTKTE